MAEEKLALFDFDDTLCKGDSIVPYLIYCIMCGLAPKEQVWKAFRAYRVQRKHPELASESKSSTLSFIKGRTPEEMDQVARSFFRQVLTPRFLAQGQEEIQRLKNEGYRVLVVSASAEVYMRVLPEFMPIDGVISTRCELDKQGRYSGIVSENCKGDVKPRMLAHYCNINDIQMDAAASRAYGDSPSDAALLRLVGHPVCVGKAAKLRKLVPGAEHVLWR